jgi:hypothetical protein
MRTFTLGEANALLPVLRAAIERLVEKQCQILRLEAEIESTHILLEGHTRENASRLVDDFVKASGRYRVALRERNEGIQKISSTGAILRCPHQGILDFPAFHEGRSIFFCWHVGEPDIQYWHEGSERGAAERMPIRTLLGTGGPPD